MSKRWTGSWGGAKVEEGAIRSGWVMSRGETMSSGWDKGREGGMNRRDHE